MVWHLYTVFKNTMVLVVAAGLCRKDKMNELYCSFFEDDGL